VLDLRRHEPRALLLQAPAVYMYVYMYVQCTRMYVCMCMYMHFCQCLHRYVCMYVCMCVLHNVCVHVCLLHDRRRESTSTLTYMYPSIYPCLQEYDDDCFYYHSWSNNVAIAFGTLSSFRT